MRSLIEIAPDTAEDVCILDTEASPEHLSRGTARYADAMIAVVEPYFKSLETGRRMAVLARDLGIRRVGVVANKVRDERELTAVREFTAQHDLALEGVVPYDDRFPEAERAGVAPLDFDADAPAITAIGEIAERLVTHGRA